MAISRRSRAIVTTIVVAVLASGYGVYWWHQGLWQRHVALAYSVEHALERGDVAQARYELDQEDPGTTLQALLMLLRSELERTRLFVVRELVDRAADRPKVREALAKVAATDPSQRVREVASQALSGAKVESP